MVDQISVENEKIQKEIKNINNNIECKQYKKIPENNDDLYNDFDISSKTPIHILKYHEKAIYCSIILSDGRFATGSEDSSIIIYDNKNFKPDLIIREHSKGVCCILELSSGMLSSCSIDNTIKIFDIKKDKYTVFQTLNYHKGRVIQIIELANKQLVSCSFDSFIIVYSKVNSNYEKDYHIKANGNSFYLIQTKENELCFQEKEFLSEYDSICFYDLFKRKIINKLDNMKIRGWNPFNMITKDLLLVTGKGQLYIINVHLHNLSSIINAPNSSDINESCLINKNTILTGDDDKKIRQWGIEGNVLKLIATKENAHNREITVLLKLGDGLILSGANDGEIKIW